MNNRAKEDGIRLVMKAKETVSIILALFFLLVYLIGFGAISELIVCVLLVLILAFSYNAARLHLRRIPDREAKEIKIKVMKLLLAFYLLIYLHLLISFTLGSTYFYRPSSFAFANQDEFAFYLKQRTNFIPFYTIKNAFANALESHSYYYLLVNVGGNILALMPMGLFLPILFKEQRRPVIFIITVTLIVALIECMQMLFLMGSCDVDDLILNVLGAVIMFLLMKISYIRKLTNKIFPGIGTDLESK